MSESKHHDHDDHEDHGHHEHDHVIIAKLNDVLEFEKIILFLQRKDIELQEEDIRLQQEDLKLQKENIQLARDQIKLQIEALKLLNQLTRPRTTDLGIQIGDSMDPVSIVVGQTVPAVAVPLLPDGVTPTPGAVVSNQAYSVDNGSVASIDANGIVAGLAEGTATVSISATVTDTNGAVSQLTGTNTVTVGAAPPPQPITASLGVQFGTPTP